MACGRNFCLSIFPLAGSIVALALGLVTFLSTYESATALHKLYFMKVDFSNLTLSAVDGLPSEVTQNINQINQDLNTIREQIGIKDFYQTGVNGFCEGNENSDGSENVTDCKTPWEPYWFDLITILEDETNTGISIKLPSDIQDYNKIIHGASVAMWVCYIIAIILSALSVVFGVFSWCSRLAACCTSFAAWLCFIFYVLSSGIATGLFVTYRHYFNQNVSSFGVKASLNSNLYAITWVATAAALWSSFWWSIAACCGSSVHRRKTVLAEEKQPFIGYVQH